MRKLALAACVVASFALAPAPAHALQYVEGAIGPGTVYGIWVPDAWNGDLVLYAHGFRNPNCPLAVPTTPAALCAPLPGMLATDSGTPRAAKPMREALLEMGYAFAASSYSDTALALKEGAQQTFQLKGIFASRFGQPRKTWIYGHSMGGAIVVKLAERFPGHFDGGLAMCGMIDGTPTQAQYVVDGRASLDAILGPIYPGGVANVPEGLTFYGDVLPSLLGRFSGPDAMANVQKGFAWAMLDQVRYPATRPNDLVNGISEFLYFQTLGTPKLLEAAHGIPVDNAAVTYSGPAPIDYALLNQVAERVVAEPQAVAWAEHNYESTGALGIPLVTLHTLRDAAVPMIHEARYAQKAAQAGRSELLVQRTVDHVGQVDGHCTFTLEEELAAFSDLVAWVEGGERPKGGSSW